MIQMYADDVLVYDSRLPEYKLLALSTTKGVNKSGTATFTMLPGHPGYDSFISHKTVVTIYKNKKLHFRGRALKPADDFYNRRTITCEGERGFLADGVMRSYLYQNSPAEIFIDVITQYNSEVDSFKQFVIGEVTVTDPNNYIRFESEKAENLLTTIDSLVSRCGGYIVFTTNDSGERVINWLAELPYRSNQSIEFGKNLTDFARSEGEEVPPTAVLAYGAKDETTGEYVTLNDVLGTDILYDDAARDVRGVIIEPVYFEDITTPENLLTKAKAYLEEKKKIITSLELTAIDLSALDKNIDDFEEGDLIRVTSKPHKVDEDFLLTDKKEDLLDPAGGKVSLGKEVATLTGIGATANKDINSSIKQTVHEIKADYQLNTAKAIEETKRTLTSLIEQTSTSIKTEVAENYTTNDEVTGLIATSMTQLSDSFEFLFTELEQTVADNEAGNRAEFDEIKSYIRFEDGNIILGQSDNTITLKIENDKIAFYDEGTEVAYFSDKKLVVLDGNFLNTLRIGCFEWRPRDNGNLSLVKVGG